MLTLRELVEEHYKRSREYRIRNDNDLHSHGISPLVEEVGEFAQAVDKGCLDDMREEALDILNVDLGVLKFLYGDDYPALERDMMNTLCKLR